MLAATSAMTALRRFLLSGLAALPLACSALTWTTQTITLATAPFQKTQDATFEFKNDSDRPVTIVDLQTGCDCLTVATDQKTYAAGSRGVLTGKFTVGDRIGRYERKVTVLTDESEIPIQLVLQIDVPALADVTPQTLFWELRDPGAEKTVEVRPTGDLHIEFTELQATNEDFIARLETLVAGRHYRVHLAPRQPGQLANAAIRILGREKTGHEVVVSAYANVR